MSSTRVTLNELPTPALVLDQSILRANCERMIARCRHLAVTLRPHLKTLKSIDAARYAIDPGHGGVAVSTLKEAEYFAANGVIDIQLAVCLTPDKLARAAAVAGSAPLFSFFLDSVEMANAVVAFTRDHGVAFRVWIELDTGEHRTGVDPDGELLLAIAERLRAAPLVTLCGVATHAGHSYVSTYGPADLERIAEEERAGSVRAAGRLATLGLGSLAVSIGSTPTAMYLGQAEGVTEIRVGVYMASDLFQAALGVQRQDEIALSVLATVISRNEARGHVVIDAGGLALSKDRSTGGSAEHDMGYGLAVDIDGNPSFGRVTVGEVYQEHGELRNLSSDVINRLPIGARVRILPNHACMTAAAYDRFHVVDRSRDVVSVWTRVNGWEAV